MNGIYEPEPVGEPFARYMNVYRQAHRGVHETWPWWFGARGPNAKFVRFDRTWEVSWGAILGDIEIKRLDINPGSEEATQLMREREFPMGLQGPGFGMGRPDTVVDRFAVGRSTVTSGAYGMHTGDSHNRFGESAQDIKTYYDLWAYIDRTLARLDRELPLPVPPFMSGQVWSVPCFPDHPTNDNRSEKTVEGIAESGQAWLSWYSDGKTKLLAEPQPGWILVSGPTPWGRDIPIPVETPAKEPA